MIEFDEKTAKALFVLHESIKAAILDVLNSREKTDEQIEAVVSQMFGQCLWAILTNAEEQDKILDRLMERYRPKS
jgi:superoxide dismutase